MNSTKIKIRAIDPAEVKHLEDIMYETIYHPDKENPYPKEVIYLPQVSVYWKEFGMEKDDLCLVAEADNRIVGAVWTRIFYGEIKGCGYIDDETPELAIALYEAYRGSGTGSLMMREMIRLLKKRQYKQVSLSITKGNPAIHLYERLGFEVTDENEEDFIMLLSLR